MSTGKHRQRLAALVSGAVCITAAVVLVVALRARAHKKAAAALQQAAAPRGKKRRSPWSAPDKLKSLKTLEQLASEVDLRGRRVLVRVDFNVPLVLPGRLRALSDVVPRGHDDDDDRHRTRRSISDDTRIRRALPTIEFLANKGAKVVLVSHLGRPKGHQEDLRMTPVAERLSYLLRRQVVVLGDCLEPETRQGLEALREGDVALLENIRFYPAEEKGDMSFARKLANLADDVFVFDAFACAHRAHASVEGVARLVKHKAVGMLVQQELQFMHVDHWQRPLAAVVGGDKVHTKLPLLMSLLDHCDKVLVGGGLAFTLLRAMGFDTGESAVAEDLLLLAAQVLRRADDVGVPVYLPVDVVVADEFDALPHQTDTVPMEVGIPPGWFGMDIGPATAKLFARELWQCKTVLWDGPMGVFEYPRFAGGSNAIGQTLAQLSANGVTTIVGGGECVAALGHSRQSGGVSHISTGGAAALALLTGCDLPGVRGVCS